MKTVAPDSSRAARWRWVAGCMPGTSTPRLSRTWPVRASTPYSTWRTPAWVATAKTSPVAGS